MNKKAVWIAAAAALAVAVLAGAVLLLRGGEAVRHTGGAGTAYPYAWVEEKNGTITFTLSGAVPEGYIWDTVTSDGTVLEVVPAENGYIVTPLSEGRTSVTSTLRAADWADERVFRIELLVDAARTRKTLTASVLADSAEELPGTLRGGEEFDCPYRIWAEDDGSVTLFLSDAADWRVRTSDRAVLRASDAAPADGGVELSFYADELGVTDAVVYSASRALRLSIGFASDGAESLAILSHEMERLNVPADGADGWLDFVMAVGEIALPEGMTPLRYSAEARGRYDTGTVELSEDGTEPSCRLTVFNGADADTVSAGINSDSVVTVYIDGGAVNIHTGKGYSAAWWTYDGGACLLECGETEIGAVTELAARFIEVNSSE